MKLRIAVEIFADATTRPLEGTPIHEIVLEDVHGMMSFGLGENVEGFTKATHGSIMVLPEGEHTRSEVVKNFERLLIAAFATARMEIEKGERGTNG